MTIFNDLDLILLKEFFYKPETKEFKIITDFISKIMDGNVKNAFYSMSVEKRCRLSYAKYFENKQQFFDDALKLASYNLKVERE